MNYDLGVNEVIIMEFQRATLKTDKIFSAPTGNLVLTNLGINFYELGLTNKIKNTRKYPLSSIKTYNKVVQIKYEEVGLLTIYLQTETITFRVQQTKKECINFINEVNKLVFGENAETITYKSPTMQAVSDIFSQVKDSLGIKGTIFAKEKVVKKCEGCGCQYEGEKDTVVNCPYCGQPNKM